MSTVGESRKAAIRGLSKKTIKNMKRLSNVSHPISKETRRESAEIISDVIQGTKYTYNKTRQISETKDTEEMIGDVSSLIHNSQIAGEIEILRTESFGMDLGKEESEELKGKALVTENNQMVIFPLTNLREEETANNILAFQFVEYIVSPNLGQTDIINNELGPPILLSLFPDLSNHSYSIPSSLNTTFELYLKVNKPSDKQNCSYFDELRGNYSTAGMQLVSKDMNPDGTGLFKCTSTHLTTFGVTQNPYTEIKGVLLDSNYDTFKDTGSLEHYDPTSSLRIYIIYITYSLFYTTWTRNFLSRFCDFELHFL